MRVDFLAAINGGTERATLPNGRIVELTIPAGAAEGQKLRLKGQGESAPQGGEAGDAFVELTIRLPPLICAARRRHIARFADYAERGGSRRQSRSATPSGAVMLTVPKHSNTGAALRLKGKGVRRRDGGAGDELVTLKVMLPDARDPALEDFAARWVAKDYDPRKDWP